MTRRGRPGATWGPAGPGLAAAAALALLTGCAAPSRPALPAELPLHASEQLIQLRYALQREPSVVRAVGLADSRAEKELQLTIALFGLDAEGRIASRGVTHVRSRFAREPVPFVVELTPTGREARFVLRVPEAFLFGFRGSN